MKSWKFNLARNYDLLGHPEVPKEIFEDRPFLLKLARGDFKTIAFMPERFMLDREFVRAAMDDNPEAWRILEMAPLSIQQDRDLLLGVLRGPGLGWRALRFAGKDLRSNAEFMLEATEACGTAIGYASPEVRAEDELIFACVDSHRDKLLHAQGLETHDALWAKDDVEVTRRKSVLQTLTADNRSKSVTNSLEAEFAKGTSGAIVTSSGVMRLVQLVALNVSRRDGAVLTWMGYREPCGKVVDKCLLPGGKFKEGDSAKDAVQRLLMDELRPLAKGIKLKAGHKVKTKTMFSERYQCQTQYYTAIFEGILDPKFDLHDAMKPVDVAAIDLRPRLRSRGPRETFGKRFSADGLHSRPDMFELRYGDRKNYWPPITCEWPPKKVEIYAWLPEWEMTWLTTTDEGHAALKYWMSNLCTVSISAGRRLSLPRPHTEHLYDMPHRAPPRSPRSQSPSARGRPSLSPRQEVAKSMSQSPSPKGGLLHVPCTMHKD